MELELWYIEHNRYYPSYKRQLSDYHNGHTEFMNREHIKYRVRVEICEKIIDVDAPKGIRWETKVKFI